MSKLWKTTVDDPVFEDITPVQWVFYAEMLRQDRDRDFNEKLEFAEYIAQFLEPERVSKVRQAREKREEHAFANDEEFEEQVKQNSFKNNPYLDAIRKIKEKASITEAKDNVRRNLSEYSVLDKTKM